MTHKRKKLGFLQEEKMEKNCSMCYGSQKTFEYYTSHVGLSCLGINMMKYRVKIVS